MLGFGFKCFSDVITEFGYLSKQCYASGEFFRFTRTTLSFVSEVAREVMPKAGDAHFFGNKVGKASQDF